MWAPPRTPRVPSASLSAIQQPALLRMSGYAVFQAYDGAAAADICRFMPAGPAGGVRVDENYFVETKRLDPAVRAAASAPTGQ